MRRSAYIYVGGDIYPDGIVERPEEGDLVIAADSGYRNAKRLGVKINMLIGDMDSIGGNFDFGEIGPDVELVKLPTEKDDTDAAYAAKLALKSDCDDIVIIGGLSGRLDHTLANLSLLEYLDAAGGKNKKVTATVTDGKNRVRYIKNDGLLIPRSHFKYFSLIPVTDVCRGVTVKGCKYPLKNAKLTRDNAEFSTSNEIEGNVALIEVSRGALYIVESV